MGDKYISDHSKFIAELKAKNPAIEEGQRRGRAIFWDKRIDRDEWKRFHESELAHPAYVYQNYVGPPQLDTASPGNTPGDTKTQGTPATNKS